MKQSNTRPEAVIPIPIEAITPGFFLSDNLPATGDKRVMAIGWDIIIKPAVLASSPLRYCR